MTKDDRIQMNGKVEKTRDDSAAFAQKLAFDVAMLPDDVLGYKEALQAEADLAADIVEYRRLIERIKGGSY